MIEKLIKFWNRYFSISSSIKDVTAKLHEVSENLMELKRSINTDIALLENQLALKELVLQQVIDCLPDMLWMKDIDGKYVIANKAIRDGLLFDCNPIGKTDIEIAKNAKIKFGEENHTFGEKCSNSDKITLERGEPSRFLESGRLKGNMTYLEVFKNIVMDMDGKVIGVCGTGRDLTEYVKAVKEMESHCAKRCGESEVVKAFKKYEFEEK